MPAAERIGSAWVGCIAQSARVCHGSALSCNAVCAAPASHNAPRGQAHTTHGVHTHPAFPSQQHTIANQASLSPSLELSVRAYTYTYACCCLLPPPCRNPVKRVSASGATGKRGSLEVSKDRRTSGAGGPATLVDMPPETSKDALEPASMGAAAKEPKPPSVPMSRLLSYNRPEWAYAAVGIVASSANGCVNPAFAFIISSVINVFYTVVPSEMLAKAGFWSGMFVVIGAGCLIVSALQQVAS